MVLASIGEAPSLTGLARCAIRVGGVRVKFAFAAQNARKLENGDLTLLQDCNANAALRRTDRWREARRRDSITQWIAHL